MGTSYLHTGFFIDRVQRVLNILCGLLFLGYSSYELLVKENYVVGVFTIIVSISWFWIIYRLHHAGDKTASRIETTQETLIVKPHINAATEYFRWEDIQDLKVDYQKRQMIITLVNTSPNKQNRYIFSLRGFSQRKLKMAERLIQSHLNLFT